MRFAPALVLAAALAPSLATAAERAPRAGEIRVDAPRELGTTVIVGTLAKPALIIGFVRAQVACAGLEQRQAFTGRIVRDALRRPF